MSIYDLWSQGAITDVEAFIGLTGDLEEVEQVYKRAEEARKDLRGQIERVVQRLGGKAQAGGYEATMTQPAEVVSYDVRAVDAIMAECLAAGEIDVAHKLAQARRTSARAGYLRLARTK